MARSFLQVPILTRDDERAIERVSKHLQRSKADTARILFREADKRIQAEIKRASLETPEDVTVAQTIKMSPR